MPGSDCIQVDFQRLNMFSSQNFMDCYPLLDLETLELNIKY